MLEFYFSNIFRGEGISEGIERGILVDHDERCIVQEGMGLGAPAVKTNISTFFSSHSKLIEVSEREYIKEFYIDSELVWQIFKLNSTKSKDFKLLTTFINKLTDLYKRLKFIQPILLKLGILSRDFFQTNSEVKNRGLIGKVIFFYKILEDGVLIEVDFSHILKYNGRSISKICILNELGGDFFDHSKRRGKILAPPSGWVKLEDNDKRNLYSSKLKLDFDVNILEYPLNSKTDFIFGREKVSNFCWAGFDLEIDVNSIVLNNIQNNGTIKYICKLIEQKRGVN